MVKRGAAEGQVVPDCAVPTLVPKHMDLRYAAWRGGSFLPRAGNGTFLSPKANKTQGESEMREIQSQ